MPARTLADPSAREEILQRLQRLTPDAKPRWGRFDAPRMIVHVTDGLLMATGDLETAPRPGPLKLPIVKQLVMFYLPWPKSVPTAPELLARAPTTIDRELTALREALDQFARRDASGPWPDHPAFGALTGREWARLGYRHLDHHCKQFGV